LVNCRVPPNGLNEADTVTFVLSTGLIASGCGVGSVGRPDPRARKKPTPFSGSATLSWSPVALVVRKAVQLVRVSERSMTYCAPGVVDKSNARVGPGCNWTLLRRICESVASAGCVAVASHCVELRPSKSVTRIAALNLPRSHAVFSIVFIMPPLLKGLVVNNSLTSQ